MDPLPAEFALPSPAPVWGELRRRVRVLWVGGGDDGGEWLRAALAADRACDVELLPAAESAGALRLLREEGVDLILVRHRGGERAALEFAAACRGGGHDEPLLILGDESAAEWQPLCHEAGADDYLCLGQSSVRGLLWQMSRAIARQELTRENQRLRDEQAQRAQREQSEAARHLAEQRAVWVLDDEPVASAPLKTANEQAAPSREIHDEHDAEELSRRYRELLRSSIIMGTGSLGREVETCAAELIAASCSARELLRRHLDAVEELLRGLGRRSARHVANRAELLLGELLLHLADGYRERSSAPKRRRLLRKPRNSSGLRQTSA